MSEAAAAEIREVLARPKFADVLTARRQAEITGLLFADARWFVPTLRIDECRDAMTTRTSNWRLRHMQPF
jgi:predicted nucleic acid-binding protein